MPSREIRTPTGAVISHRDKALEKHLDALEAGTRYELAGLQALERVELRRLMVLQSLGKAALGVADNIATEVRTRAERNPTGITNLIYISDRINMALGERIEWAARRLG